MTTRLALENSEAPPKIAPFKPCVHPLRLLNGVEASGTERACTNSFTIRTSHAEDLGRQITKLRDALRTRGGHIQFLMWSFSELQQEHVAAVYYEVPSQLGSPASSKVPRGQLEAVGA